MAQNVREDGSDRLKYSQTLGISLNTLTNNDKLTEDDRKVLRQLSVKAETIASHESFNNPKIEQLVTILTEFQDKMLVFTKYKTTQAFLANVLKKRGFKVAEFHGGLNRKEKEEQIAYFKESADVLVSTECY